jgi:ribA/ribD-fused uncharacterized protein
MTSVNQTPHKIIYFWHPDRKFGFLSNWYSSSFEDFDTELPSDGGERQFRTFSSVQQYMIYHRVMLFEDKEAASRVLQTNDTNELKKIGRDVQGFDIDIWNNNKESIATKGAYLKFKQNPELCRKLVDTGDAILAESSKFDKNWGIGLNMRDAIKLNGDTSKWNGKNLLGKCLMQVRDYLCKEMYSSSAESELELGPAHMDVN